MKNTWSLVKITNAARDSYLLSNDMTKEIEELRATYYGVNPKKTGVYVDIKSTPVMETRRKPGRRKPRRHVVTSPVSEEDSPESQ